MKQFLALTLSTAFLLGSFSFAHDYQCQASQGCQATMFKDGKVRKVLFRKGDVVNTAGGWVVDEKDGWVRVPNRDESDGADV